MLALMTTLRSRLSWRSCTRASEHSLGAACTIAMCTFRWPISIWTGTSDPPYEPGSRSLSRVRSSACWNSSCCTHPELCPARKSSSTCGPTDLILKPTWSRYTLTDFAKRSISPTVRNGSRRCEASATQSEFHCDSPHDAPSTDDPGFLCSRHRVHDGHLHCRLFHVCERCHDHPF